MGGMYLLGLHMSWVASSLVGVVGGSDAARSQDGLVDAAHRSARQAAPGYQCEDSPAEWTEAADASNDCTAYTAKGWCNITNAPTYLGPNWNSTERGTFEGHQSASATGFSTTYHAGQACCGCGGGNTFSTTTVTFTTATGTSATTTSKTATTTTSFTTTSSSITNILTFTSTSTTIKPAACAELDGVSPYCYERDLGDGLCNIHCNTKSCGYDAGDCRCTFSHQCQPGQSCANGVCYDDPNWQLCALTRCSDDQDCDQGRSSCRAGRLCVQGTCALECGHWCEDTFGDDWTADNNRAPVSENGRQAGTQCLGCREKFDTFGFEDWVTFFMHLIMMLGFIIGGLVAVPMILIPAIKRCKEEREDAEHMRTHPLGQRKASELSYAGGESIHMHAMPHRAPPPLAARTSGQGRLSSAGVPVGPGDRGPRPAAGKPSTLHPVSENDPFRGSTMFPAAAGSSDDSSDSDDHDGGAAMLPGQAWDANDR